MFLTDDDRLEQIRDQSQTLLNQIQDLNKLGIQEFKDLTRISLKQDRVSFQTCKKD